MAPAPLSSPARPTAAPAASTSALGSPIAERSDEDPLLAVPAEEQPPPEKRASLYVQIAEESIQTVLEKERYLFSESELGILKRFTDLPDEAKYIFTRLTSRKPSKWHRLSALVESYSSEFADVPGACDVLTRASLGALPTPPPEADGDPEVAQAIAASLEDVRRAGGGWEGVELAQTCAWLRGEEVGAGEVLDCLAVDELKAVAKECKVLPKGSPTRAQLIQALTTNASKQTTLGFLPVSASSAPSSSKSRLGAPKQMTLCFGKGGAKLNQTSRIKNVALKKTGKLIRLHPAVHALFQRLALVYNRLDPHLAPPHSLLARFKKRAYPITDIARSEVWASRTALVEYQEALKVEARMDAAVEAHRWDEAREIGESVLERWRVLVKEGEALEGWRRRFTPGHIFTRCIYHLPPIYSRAKQYDAEIALLRELLSQRVFRRGRRGAWYCRIALVLMTHYKTNDHEKREKMEDALEVCKEGLLDDDTHFIYRPDLVNRIAKLEKNKLLSIPTDEKTKCEGFLRKPGAKEVPAERVWDVAEAKDKGKGKAADDGAGAGERRSWGVHSVWKGRDEPEVRVEQVALEAYEDEGWKGLHCEGRIVRTIFTLIMWDVLFAAVSGAFETPFQIAPLDLREDSFYFARKEAIDGRLEEIKEGGALKLLDEADDRERLRSTWAVGVNWDYEKKMLLEVTECLGGPTLAHLCKVLCEDWDHRAGGMPDLILWNPAEKTAMFSEVKGPGDTLSETQKVWIDVLLAGKIDVDLCSVVVKNPQKSSKLPVKAKGKKRASPGPKEESEEPESEGEEEKGRAQKRVKREVKEEEVEEGGEDEELESEDE